MYDSKYLFNHLLESKLPFNAEDGVQEAELLQDTGSAKSIKKGITGSALKIIAIICMLADHIALFLLYRILLQRGLGAMTDQQSLDVFRAANAGIFIVYNILRMIGRIAFPIFCFLLVQGFLHTRNVKKYLGGLFLFALISEIPFDLATSSNLFYWGYQNVYFTLFLGVLALFAIHIAEQKTEWHMAWRVSFGLIATLLCVGVAYLLKADYDIYGVLIIVIFYLPRPKRMLPTGICCAMLFTIPAFISMIPIYFYNGKRGCNIKWLFYIFYPAHILLLYLIAVAMGSGHLPIL